MPVKEDQKRILTLQDRCDRCGAQAFILAKGMQGELYFCGHHYNKTKDAINSWAFEVINELEFINEKNQSSNI